MVLMTIYLNNKFTLIWRGIYFSLAFIYLFNITKNLTLYNYNV